MVPRGTTGSTILVPWYGTYTYTMVVVLLGRLGIFSAFVEAGSFPPRPPPSRRDAAAAAAAAGADATPPPPVAVTGSAGESTAMSSVLGMEKTVVRDSQLLMTGPLMKAPKQRPKPNNQYTMGPRSQLRQRWFTLDAAGHFDYYADASRKTHKGVVRLSGA
jgi:hypothetical protein